MNINKWELLEFEIIKAMKTKNKERLGALRVLKAEIQKESIDNRRTTNTELVEEIASKISKQMEKSLKIAKDEKNEWLRDICTEFMPTQYTKEVAIEYIETNGKEIEFKSSGQLIGFIKKHFGNSITSETAKLAAEYYFEKKIKKNA